MIRQRVDLEQKLKESSCDELWKDLQQIKGAAQQIWQTPKLRWYPDHGLRHSHRIIELIGQIVEPLYRRNPDYFLPEELFVLLASCYLHDIGMQDLRVRVNEEDEN
ncbi:MAG: hypothetical protein Q8M54_09685, partial [Desulfobaccales bacterium]|nr:hypothetical protein [Desulfobaccales bacterium]